MISDIFSPETNLRDALVQAFKADEGYLNQRVGVDRELNFDLMADIALAVIKDWTVPGPPVEIAKAREVTRVLSDIQFNSKF